MRTRLRALAAIAFVLFPAFAGSGVGCTPAPTTPNDVTASPAATASAAIDSNVPPPPPPRDDGRLPETATPLGYELTLWIDPQLPTFHGTAEIAVDVPAPTRHVVLHARDMTVTHAEAVAGSARIAASTASRITHGGVVPEELVVTFERELPAGKATIRIDYGAPFAADLSGLYRVQEKGLWYAYTQFEATDARRAFPCFDEPRYKTPFRVHIHAPAGAIALANAPARPAAPSDAPGQAVTFETTPPLPTYLVAFAVGPFDILSGPPHDPPIRVVTTRGRSGLAGLALETAQAMIEQLSDYFDMAYPYAKLDIVAVPDFGAGAMENPGLVTFRDTLLLVDRDHATTSIKRSQASVIAHEFAHQWFGDLGHDAVVGRPVAERGLRDVGRSQDGRPLAAVVRRHPRADRGDAGGDGRRRPPVGARRPGAGAVDRRGQGGVRRAHLRQGRRGPPHDRELARRRHVPARRPAVPQRERVEERARRRPLQGDRLRLGAARRSAGRGVPRPAGRPRGLDELDVQRPLGRQARTSPVRVETPRRGPARRPSHLDASRLRRDEHAEGQELLHRRR